MNKKDTKQAILGFTEFFKGITGNQDLKIPDDIAKKYEIEPNKWIPVSERYPTDVNKEYLVCYEDGVITIEFLFLDGDGHPFFSEMELGVIAWMPLPLPYKASPIGTEKED